jgi:hypothetical protein
VTVSPRFTFKRAAAEPPLTDNSRNPALPQIAKSSELDPDLGFDPRSSA